MLLFKILWTPLSKGRLIFFFFFFSQFHPCYKLLIKKKTPIPIANLNKPQ